jgi:hypothetical protein
MWKDDFKATKRERVIQLKALNMTCDEQIAMLKRSVEKGVIVGPRQYASPRPPAVLNLIYYYSIIQFVEKANNVSVSSLLDLMEIAKMLKCKDFDISLIRMNVFKIIFSVAKTI